MNAKANLDFLVPFNIPRPYRTNKQLQDKIHYLFSHPTFKHNKLYTKIANSGSKQLTQDMSRVALSMVQEFYRNPQQYGHNLENIEWQILIRMWRQTFKHTKLQSFELTLYKGVKQSLLSIENQWVEELIRTHTDKDYIMHNNDMVKVRDGVGLRDRVSFGTHEGSSNFEYLCSLE